MMKMMEKMMHGGCAKIGTTLQEQLQEDVQRIEASVNTTVAKVVAEKCDSRISGIEGELRALRSHLQAVEQTSKENALSLNVQIDVAAPVAVHGGSRLNLPPAQKRAHDKISENDAGPGVTVLPGGRLQLVNGHLRVILGGWTRELRPDILKEQAV